MPSQLPYLNTYKNVGKLFEKIHTAKRPEALTNKFLYDTLGLKSTNDRPLIALLKTLGFLDGAGNPTPAYDALKAEKKVAAQAIARGIRRGYAPLFEANEKANELGREQLKGLVAQVAGTDTNTTAKIVGTLISLLSLADFSEGETQPRGEEIGAEETNDTAEEEETGAGIAALKFSGMNHQFHYNIQVHLPANGSEETYMNIFNALRKVFK